METAAGAAPSMELPECPVCLQEYDESDVVPRVLPCGHSACDRCLALLPSPPPHPNTVRCPSCNQLARFPSPLGPKSLPKNIDLLRFCCPSGSKPGRRPVPEPEGNPGSRPLPYVEFLPRPPWTDELLQAWKPWILPRDSITLLEPMVDQILVLGIHLSSSHEEQKVSLFPIYESSCKPKLYRLSYMARIIELVHQLREGVRAHLQVLLEACANQRNGICRVLGLWTNPNEETCPLFLVCEKFDHTLAGTLSNKGKWRLGLETVEKFGFGMVGMELCEVVMSFHKKGVVFGCLDMDCFSFDMFGHCLLDLNNVLAKSRRLCKDIKDKHSNSSETKGSLSPEVFLALHEGSLSVDYSSDVWSLGCMLAMILTGDAELPTELFEYFQCSLLKGDSGKYTGACFDQYEVWREKVISKLEGSLMETKFEPLLQILSSCLQYDLESRSEVRDMWYSIRGHFVEMSANDIAAFDEFKEKDSKESLVNCLSIGNMGNVPKETNMVLEQQANSSTPESILKVGLAEISGTNMDQTREEVDVDFSQGLEGGGFQFDTIRGHNDCITGLAVGGGYLFSSSFDKTVSVWSLQDFSHVKSLKGHEHRVMAMVVMDDTQLLCISGDSGGGIFVWRIGTSLGQELVQKWYEHTDWRYSGIHSLAISEGYLYSGSGDKSIKAWSLQDYSLACTMTGHNSTVSSLAVANGILYSGSWDGTIRLWCLGDHSLLAVLGDDNAGPFVPVLSLTANRHFLVSSYENGSIKIWKNDAFVRSVQIQDGAIFAVHMDMKWLFTAGWSKSVSIQEWSENDLEMDIRPVASIPCDSVITSLFYWCGKLFAGFSNKEIKVYYYGTR